MDISQIVYFRAAARHGHFGRAADELGIAQPTLSRTIRALETHYGTTLFDRVGRTVRLNESGRILLSHAERALQALDDAENELRARNVAESRTISVGFIGTLAIRVVPTLVQSFRANAPEADFRLFQSSPKHLFERLRDGSIDCCFTFSVPTDAEIAWQPLWEQELFVHVPAHHRLAGKAKIDLAEIASEPFVGFERGTGMRAITDRLCAEAGFTPRMIFEGQTSVMLRGLIAAGMGGTLAPDMDGPRQDDVVLVAVRKPRCRQPIGISWLRERYASPLALRFREHTCSTGSVPATRAS